ncbi:2-hydroxyacid dehydrogenase [Paenibacillus crassostreae]|uniref:Glyoxylate/hydroxypyruvate reductase B n=1 Tax=Paenibacillus crassostreae TaxID=1763538 RepID=A0A167B9R9_9BACL|nr:D-glycerate dehydrogenase [Paenibacillus crassostreae]AOZ93044.1 D-glycerate dehydrogenase [Paenibacillus crassostreae]OAB71868.1 D-glycerate dehydrogenase [Paenibacillus crassostreae]
MEKYKVAIMGPLYPDARARLEEVCEIKLWDKSDPIPRDELVEWLADAEGFISRGDIKVDKDLLSQAPQLRVIAQSSVGYDNIDISACTEQAIPVGNTPVVLVEATADLTFGLVLSSARRIHEGWNYVQEGHWTSRRNIPLGVDLFGKTLGIVGMGNIGVAVARRAQASGMQVIYHNRSIRTDQEQLAATFVNFDQLLEESDFIVVLVPLSAESRHLFGKDQFKHMKSSAYFINASRGPVVDTEALYEALVNQDIAYAALDVVNPEPFSDHPLIHLPNVLITPHIGSATLETRTQMGELTADNLLAGLAKQTLPKCVNDEVNY